MLNKQPISRFISFLTCLGPTQAENQYLRNDLNRTCTWLWVERDDVLSQTASNALTDIRVAAVSSINYPEPKPDTTNCKLYCCWFTPAVAFPQKNANCDEVCGKWSLNSQNDDTFTESSIALSSLSCMDAWINQFSTLLMVLALCPGGENQKWTLYVTVCPRVQTTWDFGVQRDWRIDAAPDFWSRSRGSGTGSLQSHCQRMRAPGTHTHTLLLPPAECINYGLTGGCWMNTPQG